MKKLLFALCFASLLAIILLFGASDSAGSSAVKPGPEPPSPSATITITMTTCGELGELIGPDGVAAGEPEPAEGEPTKR